MKLQSPAFLPYTQLPTRYTCFGDNVSPPLNIDEVLPKTQTLAFVMEETAANGKIFTYWLVWNVNPRDIGINENSIPQFAIQGKNDFRKVGYSGPCPSSGRHSYVFRVYALDKSLDLSEGAKREDLERAIKGHVLDQAQLAAVYSKQ